MPKNTALSRRAAVAKGALFTYLGPRLAQDAKVDLAPVLARIQAGKPFAASKDAVAVALRAATKDKLAMDADIDDVAALLDAIENVVDEAAVGPSAVDPAVTDDPHDDVMVGDPDQDGELEVTRDDDQPEMMAKIREFIKDHVDESVLDQFDQLVSGSVAPAEADEPEDIDPDLDDDLDDDVARDEGEDCDDGRMGKDRRMGQDRKPRFITPRAMDEAIQKARTDERQVQRAIGAARDHVRPVVGELTIAFDSAEDVYRTALQHMKVKVDGVHPTALRPIFEAHSVARATSRPRREGERLAADAALPAGVKPLSERLPAMGRIEVM